MSAPGSAGAAALLFDLDGTLADTRRDIAFSLNHTLRLLARPLLSRETVERYVGDGVRQLLARALGSEDPGLLDRAVGEFLPHYLAHCTDSSTLYAGVAETLARLAPRGLAVVTNKPEAHTRKTLSDLGIAGFFPVVLGGDSLPERKPDPEPLRVALRRLGAPPGSAWMVGDSPVDIRAARAAGVRAAAVTYGFRREPELVAEKPDALLSSFLEVLELPPNGSGKGDVPAS